MKHSMVLKALALVLAAVALAAAVGGAVGLVALADSGLYNKTVAELRQERLDSVVESVANALAREYIEDNLSDMTENALRHSEFFNGYDYYQYVLNEELGSDGWSYAIREGSKVVKQDEPPQQGMAEYSCEISLVYPKLLWYEAVREEGDSAATTVPGEGITEPSTTSPTFARTEADDCMRWYNDEAGCFYDYYFQYVSSPEYRVSIYLPQGYHPYNTNRYWNMLQMLSGLRNLFLPAMLIGLAVFAVAIVYLILAAGHSRGTARVRAGGLNRLPLDLYTAAAVGGVGLLAALGVMLFEWIYYENEMVTQPGFNVLVAMPFLGASLLIAGYIFALAAQFKTGGGFWWRNSIIGRCLRLIARGCRWFWRQTVRLLSVMNTMWQWMTVAVVLCGAILLTTFMLVLTWDAGWFVLLILEVLVVLAVAAYGAYAFGLILEGARRMSGGDLNRKIATKRLVGCFADCAGQLNSLADVAVVAAQKQLKSERMKTELITNVSHDIKTPLTSIINYVDLLQKPHTDQAGEEYLAVLARQSGQLKKLIDDLMEMSKASTGNMAVEITEVDAMEAVNQAMGEYADKLAAVPLIPVVRCPEEKVMIRADGRLAWRALSNLLQNAVKYALPGTRLYVDVLRAEGSVIVSLKNISREELNISADELMERFVRGDASRNTEGSGLGLNIARSLMELQRGQLQLTVDGDLFKASLIFPAAE